MAEQCGELEAERCDQLAPHMAIAALPHYNGRRFLTISSLLACRVHLALLVPLAKMALMESLAPSGLQVPVVAQEKQALL